MVDVLLSVFFTLSLFSIGANLFLFLELKKAKKHPPASPTIEATQILNDLTINGFSIVKVSRMDPNNFIVRSPRDKS